MNSFKFRRLRSSSALQPPPPPAEIKNCRREERGDSLQHFQGHHGTTQRGHGEDTRRTRRRIFILNPSHSWMVFLFPPDCLPLSGRRVCCSPSLAWRLQTTEIILTDFNKPLFMLFILICQKLDINVNNSPLNVCNLIIYSCIEIIQGTENDKRKVSSGNLKYWQ